MDTIKLDSRKTLAHEMADHLREILKQGNLATDQYLPPERELGARYNISRVTVRRGLMQLVKEGWLEAIPYKGYRPTSPERQKQVSRKAVYMTTLSDGEAAWPRTEDQLLNVCQRRLLSQGVSTTGMSCFGRDPQTVFAELVEMKIWGVLLDSSQPDMIAAALTSGLPCVLVNAMVDTLPLDVVIQDNYNGTRLGTQYLVRRGRTKIGYIGTTRKMAHSQERYAGYMISLHDAGLVLNPDWVIDPGVNELTPEAANRLFKLLKRADRPDALVVPWLAIAIAIKRAATEVGLPDNRLPEIVAWGNEQEYREFLAPQFLPGEVPATMVWRLEDMADLAIERLRSRSEQRQIPLARMDVPVRLVKPQPAEAVLKNNFGKMLE